MYVTYASTLIGKKSFVNDYMPKYVNFYGILGTYKIVLEIPTKYSPASYTSLSENDAVIEL